MVLWLISWTGAERCLMQPQYPYCLADIDASELQKFGEQFLADTRIHRGGAPFFIDKMPNNFRHIGLIHMILAQR